MDYRMFNVRTWSFLCVRIHAGLGTPTVSQHTIFDSEKLSQIVLVLLTQTGFEPPVFGYRVRRCTNWATPSPLLLSCYSVVAGSVFSVFCLLSSNVCKLFLLLEIGFFALGHCPCFCFQSLTLKKFKIDDNECVCVCVCVCGGGASLSIPRLG